jgi:hypothetical protein
MKINCSDKELCNPLYDFNTCLILYLFGFISKVATILLLFRVPLNMYTCVYQWSTMPSSYNNVWARWQYWKMKADQYLTISIYFDNDSL